MADLKNILLAADALAALTDPMMAAAGLCSLTANTLQAAGSALITVANGVAPPTVICDLPAGTAAQPLPNAQVTQRLDGGELGAVQLVVWWCDPPPSFAPAEMLLRQLAARFESVLARLNCLDMPYGRRLDFETGIWLHQEFITQVERRIDRLDIEGKYGTLLLFGWARSDGSDRPVSTGVMIRASVDRLRDMLRPADILCRLETAKIGAWCDGMDHLTAAERATRIAAALQAPIEGSGRHCVVGIASRNPGSGIDIGELLTRAEIGLLAARQTARTIQEPIVRIAEGAAENA